MLIKRQNDDGYRLMDRHDLYAGAIVHRPATENKAAQWRVVMAGEAMCEGKDFASIRAAEYYAYAMYLECLHKFQYA